MIRLRIPQKHCDICGRFAGTGQNRPHSLKRTKRVVLLNLQRKNGRLICTRCLRTIKRHNVLTQKVPA